MRKHVTPKRLALVAGASLIVIFALMLIRTEPAGRITTRWLKERNVGTPIKTIVVSNGTEYPQVMHAWLETTTNRVLWNKSGGSTTTPWTLQPRAEFKLHMVVPAIDQNRVTILYARADTNRGGFLNWRQWRAQAMTFCGMNPVQQHKMYVEFH